MRTSMAYFAGAGTVIAAIGLGLGGGLTIANVVSPHHEKLEQTKLEQRMSAKAIPPSPQADQPKLQAEQTKSPVPYVAATNAAISANTPPAQTESQPQPRLSRGSGAAGEPLSRRAAGQHRQGSDREGSAGQVRRTGGREVAIRAA